MTRIALLLGSVDLALGMQQSLVEFRNFLQSPGGGSWSDGEILVCGPLNWQFAELMAVRIRPYDQILVYECRLKESSAVPFVQSFTQAFPNVEYKCEVCTKILGPDGEVSEADADLVRFGCAV